MKGASIIRTEARDRVIEALFLAEAYIKYIEQANPTLHSEANGSPAIDKKISAAMMIMEVIKKSYANANAKELIIGAIEYYDE